MLISGYDLDKAAQVVAFFATRQGGSINVLKVSKLAYLAERECMRIYDEPMYYDKLVSMPDGPVASVTLNFMNGVNKDTRWEKFVSCRSGYYIPASKPDFSRHDFDHLSDADIDILDALWERFGHFDQFEIRDWTHNPDNIPEWIDPDGSSDSIPHERVFHGLAKEGSDALAEDVQAYRELASALNCK